LNEFHERTLERFLADLASESPTPGGGTAAAVTGAVGASLVEMVAQLTLSKDKFASAHSAMRAIAERARGARNELLRLADRDSRAYDAVVAARRLPKESELEKSIRGEAIQKANREATEVPMRTAHAAADLLAQLPELAEKGNPNALSDAGSAALFLQAAVEAALLNVGINLPGISDSDFVAAMREETAQIQSDTQRLRSQVLGAVRKSF